MISYGSRFDLETFYYANLCSKPIILVGQNKKETPLLTFIEMYKINNGAKPNIDDIDWGVNYLKSKEDIVVPITAGEEVLIGELDKLEKIRDDLEDELTRYKSEFKNLNKQWYFTPQFFMECLIGAIAIKVFQKLF